MRGARSSSLSDRGVDEEHAAIPMLLAVGAVHHHLIREGKRLKADLVVETGSAWDIHHLALLLGYGANAVHPYLALATSRSLAGQRDTEELTADEAERNYQTAVGPRPAEDHVQDGHLHPAQLPRRPDLRDHRAGPAGGGPLLQRHACPLGRHRPGGDRRRRSLLAPRGLRGAQGEAAGHRLRTLSPGRRAPRLQPRSGQGAAAGGADGRLPGLPGVLEPGARRPAAHPARHPRPS